MSKLLNNNRKKSVELAPSRIRRDPPPAQRPGGVKDYWDPTRWDTWVVVTGVVLFAIAVSIIIVGFSDYTS